VEKKKVIKIGAAAKAAEDRAVKKAERIEYKAVKKAKAASDKAV
jgi:hypothetical protein